MDRSRTTILRPPGETAGRRTQGVHAFVVIALYVLMSVELALTLFKAQWINAFLILAIMAVPLVPNLLHRRFRLYVPLEFQVLATVFVFAALFLGEIRSYYDKIWWWDIALHTSSGLLLGILGFALIYVLNEDERVDLHLRPRFMAVFAFFFAIAVGALWEIFEFAMDRLVGTNMQKPMGGDSSGLTDTMWDLIVDTLGALIISLLGGWRMSRRQSWMTRPWIYADSDREPLQSKSRR